MRLLRVACCVMYSLARAKKAVGMKPVETIEASLQVTKPIVIEGGSSFEANTRARAARRSSHNTVT